MDLVGLIRSSSEEVAIRILNQLPYSTLDQLFEMNPDLSQRYRALYELGIIEYTQLGINNQNQPNPLALRIETNLQHSLDNPIIYFQYHPPGLLSAKMTSIMNRLSNITINDQEVYTMEMLLNWWYIFIVINKLLLPNDFIQPNQIMDTLFAADYNQYGLIPGQPFHRSFLQLLLMNHISYDINLELTPDITQFLFQESVNLRTDLAYYRNILEATQGQPSSFLIEAIESE